MGTRRLTIKETASALVGANVTAAKFATKVTIGNVINDRVAAIILPKMPLMVRAMASSNPALTKVLIANAVSGAIIHFAPTNEKAVLASDAMINAAMLEFAGSFNIEQMINEALDGLDLSVLGNSEDTFDVV